MKTDLILHKNGIELEKEYVINKVEEFESKLKNLTDGKEHLWRKLKQKIKSISKKSKMDFEKKLFGELVFDSGDGRGVQFDDITSMKLHHK